MSLEMLVVIGEQIEMEKELLIFHLSGLPDPVLIHPLLPGPFQKPLPPFLPSFHPSFQPCSASGMHSIQLKTQPGQELLPPAQSLSMSPSPGQGTD